jgi:hypothetical protein
MTLMRFCYTIPTMWANYIPLLDVISTHVRPSSHCRGQCGRNGVSFRGNNHGARIQES